MENQFEPQKQRQGKYNKLTTNVLTVEEVAGLMADVLADMEWLEELVKARIDEIENDQKPKLSFSQFPPPALLDGVGAYQKLIKSYDLSSAERLLLICTLLPQVAPERLTYYLRHKDQHIKLKYAEFGGYIDLLYTHYVPTLQTVLFLLAGDDKTNAAYYKMAIFNNSTLIKEGIIQFESPNHSLENNNELLLVANLTREYLHYFLSGQIPRPDYGRAFPATWVTTELDWEHLILNDKTKSEINEIMQWVGFGDKLIEKSKLFNTSYPCLFYGPSGTGKSLTAKLIGKKYNKDVFRVDLSMIVSKYVGETEKNLAYLFDRAQGKDWILFFDEADSLFSKRTEVGNANDKWANLEVSYLLQRMEEHKGLTILATNLRENIDSAMTRRFQKIIFFPFPKMEERLKMWNSLMPDCFKYDEDVNLEKLAKFEFTGANIANIIKHACLATLTQNSSIVSSKDLANVVAKEFIKEKRTP